MSKKQKIVLWVAGIVTILLICCSVISNHVYLTLLPKVGTYHFISITTLEMELEYWVLPECVFKGKTDDTGLLYRIQARRGPFAKEFFADVIEVNILREDDGKVLVYGPNLQHHENLIRTTTQPLSDDVTVDWLNPGKMY